VPGTTCPECGAEVPEETGQHALTPSVGLVQCPSCGAKVTLPKPGSAESQAPGANDGEPETFSGHETVEGVMEEIRKKEES